LQLPDGWENPTLEGVFEALAARSGDMDGYFLNRGEQSPLQPGSRLLGETLYAAATYE
jgi:hypothetical protein